MTKKTTTGLISFFAVLLFALAVQSPLCSASTPVSPQEDGDPEIMQKETGNNTDTNPASTSTSSSDNPFTGVDIPGLVSTIVYGFLGLVLFVISYRLFEWMTPFSIGKELIEDENTALGTLMAGVAIGISIIVAAAIV